MAVKNPIQANFFGETKEIMNGQVVNDIAVNATYDGKVLHVDKRENAQTSHYDINATNIKKLLATPTSNTNLFKRLKQDYRQTLKKRTQKKKQHKRQKKKTKGKRS